MGNIERKRGKERARQEQALRIQHPHYPQGDSGQFSPFLTASSSSQHLKKEVEIGNTAFPRKQATKPNIDMFRVMFA